MPATSALPVSRPVLPRPALPVSGPGNRPALAIANGNGFGPAAARQKDAFTGPVDFPPKGALGPAKTVDEAKKLHMTQWGPSPYNAGGHEMGYADCGPTSGVIALTALGLINQPSPKDAPKAIDYMRDLCDGRDGDQSHLMDWNTLRRGLKAAGANSDLVWGTQGIDQALARGSVCILGGQNPWGAWGAKERAKGNYLASGNGGHFVAVVGKQADGKYLLADPLLKNTPIAVTGQQLLSFAVGNGAGGIEVWKGR
jgi:hypothetical protein